MCDYCRRSAELVTGVYPLNVLGDRRLVRPLVVSVEHDGPEIVMSNGRLRIWGVGADVYEALADFTQTYADVMASYENTPANQLSRGAAEYLRELKAVFAE